MHNDQFSLKLNNHKDIKVNQIRLNNWDKLSLVHPTSIYFYNKKMNNIEDLINSYYFLLSKVDKKLIPLFKNYYSSFFNFVSCASNLKIIYLKILYKTVGFKTIIRRFIIDFFKLICSIIFK